MIKLQDKSEVWNSMKAKLVEGMYAVVCHTTNHNTALAKTKGYAVGRHSNIKSISYHRSARKAREAVIVNANQIVADGDQGTLRLYKPNGDCKTFGAESL